MCNIYAHNIQLYMHQLYISSLRNNLQRGEQGNVYYQRMRGVHECMCVVCVCGRQIDIQHDVAATTADIQAATCLFRFRGHSRCSSGVSQSAARHFTLRWRPSAGRSSRGIRATH